MTNSCVEILPVMNDTKWNELRLAMHAMDQPPKWRVLSENGFYSPKDGDWYYHFSAGGYTDIIYADIFIGDVSQRGIVLALLQKINLPGIETPDGFRIFGYVAAGETVDYL